MEVSLVASPKAKTTDAVRDPKRWIFLGSNRYNWDTGLYCDGAAHTKTGKTTQFTTAATCERNPKKNTVTFTAPTKHLARTTPKYVMALASVMAQTWQGEPVDWGGTAFDEAPAFYTKIG
ncbi:hypothetical protein AB0N29_01810 [Nocardioides sp. NPDC092400]|uniref:hypothetical protein n=1 Tax=Nocardioides sp. NPDC092400 TaxID=3155196 RepID=UPI0034172D3C